MTTQTEEWEKEFDSEFVEMGLLRDMHNRPPLYDTKDTDINDIKDFIRTLLTQERTRLKEEMLRNEIVKLEGMKLVQDYEDGVHRWSHMKDMWGEAYAEKVNAKVDSHNQALQTIIDRYQYELDALSKINK